MQSETPALRIQRQLEEDEALAHAIRRELHEDALTTDLSIEVEVSGGVAHLSGSVTDIVDAENAEEVANRVPGVQEVVDELDILQPGDG